VILNIREMALSMDRRAVSLLWCSFIARHALADLSIAQLQGLTECAFALIRKVNLEMGELLDA
jgi:hypothetical protein